MLEYKIKRQDSWNSNVFKGYLKIYSKAVVALKGWRDNWDRGCHIIYVMFEI